MMMMSGKTQRRRDVFAVGVLFLSLGASSSKESAFAYGTGGWKDCEPICDSLKGGFAAQQKLQEEMMRQSMGGDDTGAEAKEESKGKKAAGIGEGKEEEELEIDGEREREFGVVMNANSITPRFVRLFAPRSR
jgi:hypothetical protein